MALEEFADRSVLSTIKLPDDLVSLATDSVHNASQIAVGLGEIQDLKDGVFVSISADAIHHRVDHLCTT